MAQRERLDALLQSVPEKPSGFRILAELIFWRYEVHDKNEFRAGWNYSISEIDRLDAHVNALEQRQNVLDAAQQVFVETRLALKDDNDKEHTRFDRWLRGAATAIVIVEIINIALVFVIVYTFLH
jgi:hypothetical protein